MLKFSEIFEFSKEKFRKIPILKEFEWFEWFEWFGPSPIEPFNSAFDHRSNQRNPAVLGEQLEKTHHRAHHCSKIPMFVLPQSI